MRTEEQKAARRTPEARAAANAYTRLYRLRPIAHQRSLEATAAYYHRHRNEINSKRKERYATDPDCRAVHKQGNLRWLYGITLEQYEALKQKQSGVCAICLSPGTDKRRKHLCVDHDHKTGRVRGLLCSKCNVALGFLKENSEIIGRLVKYLEVK